jgi:hypothetical protein
MPLDTLVIGVGHLEEPLSILATCAEALRLIRTTRGEIKLSDLLKLDFIDLRASEEINLKYSFGKGYGSAENPVGKLWLTQEQRAKMQEHPFRPSFISDYPAGFELRNGEYSFSQEIRDQVQEAMLKGKFSTRIQDFIATNKQQYPLIFFNNVITHLGNEGEQVTHDLTTKTLEKDGIIFMHHSGNFLDAKGTGGISRIVQDNPLFAHLEKIGPAVYKRRQ